MYEFLHKLCPPVTNFVGHSAKPERWVAVSTAYFAPKDLAALIHWSVLSWSAEKVDAGGGCLWVATGNSRGI